MVKHNSRNDEWTAAQMDLHWSLCLQDITIAWVPLCLRILGRTDKTAQIVWKTVPGEVNLLWTILRTTWLHIKHIPGSKARSQLGHLLCVCLIRKVTWGLTIKISHCSRNTPESPKQQIYVTFHSKKKTRLYRHGHPKNHHPRNTSVSWKMLL